jgi:hypothetical protein
MRHRYVGSWTTALLAVVAAVPMAARAQTSDVFAVNYYANTDAEDVDATVRITNPGTNGAPSPTGDLCALVYVFSADQQLAECCGCLVTPNGLRTLSVRSDLTTNPLTPVRLETGALKIVSSTPTSGKCNAATATPTPELISWATHVQRPGSGASVITETAFEKATLSSSEIGVLTEKCGDIQDNGSGHGICSCGAEEAD